MSTDQSKLVEFTLGESGIPEVLRYWANEIEKTANELCKDRDCKEIQFKIDLNRNLLMYAADYNALECLILGAKKLEKNMPVITREIIHHAIHVCIVKSCRRFEP